MQNINHVPAERRIRPSLPVKSVRTAPLRSSPDWKPEPCRLSREELRAIIAEQLG
ncbi:hypothetical protein MWN34_07435 [Ancylobacter sp. 6x-1]|uniref:Uncharacterized protein n=1 Tax=Ancylobacter crimeensis TaxID=2579147 RepID=A0ABT0D9Y1_9HYPH|nr:hypothetical protein [Ancylobacter crimeensis]MCK0196745.1 hypothetical protein [Ancylobacter crimeensis]